MDKAFTRFFTNRADSAGETAVSGQAKTPRGGRQTPRIEAGKFTASLHQRSLSAPEPQLVQDEEISFTFEANGSFRLRTPRQPMAPSPPPQLSASEPAFSSSENAPVSKTKRQKKKSKSPGTTKKKGRASTNVLSPNSDHGLNGEAGGLAKDTSQGCCGCLPGTASPTAKSLPTTPRVAGRVTRSKSKGANASASPKTPRTPRSVASKTNGSSNGSKASSSSDSKSSGSNGSKTSPTTSKPSSNGSKVNNGRASTLVPGSAGVVVVPPVQVSAAAKSVELRRSRHEPFDERSSGSSISPSSDHSNDELQSASSSNSAALAPSSSAAMPSLSGALPRQRKEPEGGFYFYTKPRLGRFTPLIALLMRLAERKMFDRGPSQWPEDVKQQHKTLLSLSNLISLCDEATSILSHEPAMLHLRLNVSREEMVIVGDIHGQLSDLYRSVLSQQYNYRAKNKDRKDKTFLFLGDFVDRGPNSLETILLVLALKVEYPHLIFLIRGNHEEKTTSRVYGFLTEAQQKLGKDEGAAVWEIITSTFASLPLSAMVHVEDRKRSERNFSFFATHGGLAPGLMETLDGINAIKRERYGANKEKAALSFLSPRSQEAKVNLPPPLSQKEEDVCRGLMWSDPTNDVGMFDRNPRGCGYLFGPSASEAFCEKNKIEFMVRAHQVVMEGYLWKHNERVLTVFSAPNYCGINGNLGAIMVLHNDEEPTNAKEAVNHPGGNSYAANNKSFNSCAFQDKSTPTTAAPSERTSHRYISFVQYDAADESDDDRDEEVLVQPSLNFPYASCFV